MRKTLRIAVVGCGSAGPAAATLLRRQGHDVTLFERAPECRPVGAGFLLQPSGMAVLRELGIDGGVLARGAKIERLHVVDRDGGDLLDLRYAELGDGLHGIGLHRPVLLHFLLEAMREAGVAVRWGCEITGAVREPDGWHLESEGGLGASGFDLLVIADGARSALRGRLGFRGQRPRLPVGGALVHRREPRRLPGG